MAEQNIYNTDSLLVYDKLGNIGTKFSIDKNQRILGNVTKTTIDVIGSGNPITFTIGKLVSTVVDNIIITIATALDTGSIEAGKDYYIYACGNSGTLTFKVSLASTFPSGYTAGTSRKIGGFHTLCVAAGTIAGHTLTGYVAGDILPQSVWDLRFRARNGLQVGMVYDPYTLKWVEIYLSSDDGASGSQSVYNATILDTLDWMTFVDKGAKVGKRLLDDDEFQAIATGSNEETNIVGSADPVTTGGHSDTAGIRMISNIGCEDCTGVLWQWLRTQSYRFEGSYEYSWYNLPGTKGSLYKQGTYGDVKLRAGGYWNDGASCGSRSRLGSAYRWSADSAVGGRFCAEPL